MVCSSNFFSSGLILALGSGGLVVWWSVSSNSFRVVSFWHLGAVVWWSGGLAADAMTFFFFHAPRPKAILEANFKRKSSIFNKENCVWKFAVFILELLKSQF